MYRALRLNKLNKCGIGEHHEINQQHRPFGKVCVNKDLSAECMFCSGVFAMLNNLHKNVVHGIVCLPLHIATAQQS